MLTLRQIMFKYLFFDKRQSQFHELNQFVLSAVELGIPTVLIDMPEIVLRLQIGNEHSIDELNQMFNQIANKIKRGEVTPNSAIAAQILFPEVFLKPKEEYMERILKDIAQG